MILQVGLPQSIRSRRRLDAHVARYTAILPPERRRPLDGYPGDCVVYTSSAGNKRGYVVTHGGRILSSNLKVGDTAPEFSAPATKRNPLVLSDLLEDKTVVLAFYPKSFTGG